LTGQGVKIAIVGSGIDTTHPDFEGRIVATAHFAEDDITDNNGHGTFNAGVVAGGGAASGGIYAGWAPEATLYIAKALTRDGTGTTQSLLEGIQWAAEQKVDIILLSIGGAGRCDGSDSISQQVDAAARAGIIAVVSAGYRGPEPGTVGPPACAHLPITVGAVDSGVVREQSSRGPTLDGRTKPDIVFFDSYVVGTRANGTSYGTVVDSNYTKANGATAHIAGLIALLLQKTPSLTPSQVKDLLMDMTIDLGFDINTQGAGLVDVERVWDHFQ
jgi:serine protease AprX